MMDQEVQNWSQLLQLAALNQLALATLALRLIEDPEIATSEIHDQLLDTVEQLENGLSRFEEFTI